MQEGTFVTSNVPFGYRRSEEGLVIDEEEAIYVRCLFSRYLDGWNSGEIAQDFQERSFHDPILARRKWTYKTVMKILKNEKYVGDVLYQKTYTTETLPRQYLCNKGERDQYYVENAHPAIIDRETYQSAQMLLRQRAEGRSPSPTGSVFTGLAVCGNCGGSFRSKTSNGRCFCVCRKHTQDAAACDMPPVSEDAMKQAFLRLYYNLKHSDILRYFYKNLSVIHSRKTLWSTDIVELNKRISDISSQSHKLSVLNQQGVVDPDVFISKSNQLAEQLRTVKQQKEDLLRQEDDTALKSTAYLMETIDAGPEILEELDEELLFELINKVIIESNVRIQFRLKNGLTLSESMERTVR